MPLHMFLIFDILIECISIDRERNDVEPFEERLHTSKSL